MSKAVSAALVAALVLVSWGPGSALVLADEAQSGGGSHGPSAAGPFSLAGGIPDLGQNLVPPSEAVSQNFSSPDLDRPYNFEADPIQADDHAEFLFKGYRFDEKTGHVFSPETKAPISAREALKVRFEAQNARRLRALQMLWHLSNLSAQEAGKMDADGAISKIVETQKDVLPKEIRISRAAGQAVFNAALRNGPPQEEIIKSWRQRHEFFKQAVLPHLARLELQQMVRPPPAGVVAPASNYFDERESRLGGGLQSELVGYLGKNPHGRALLEELKDKNGNLRLPDIVILRIKRPSRALYIEGRNLMLMSNLIAARSIVSHVPPDQVRAVQREVETDSGVADYLAAHPQAVKELFNDYGETFFHELVHHSQFLARPVDRAQTEGILPGHAPVEREYEAFFRGNLYSHEEFLAGTDVLRDSDERRYPDLLESFDKWISSIDSDYNVLRSADVVRMSTLVSLHRERSELARKLFLGGYLTKESFKAQRLNFMRGFAILRDELRQTSKMMEDFRLIQSDIQPAGWFHMIETAGTSGQQERDYDLLTQYFKRLSPSSNQETDPAVKRACQAAMKVLFAPVKPGLIMDDLETELSRRTALVEAVIGAFGGVPELEFGRQFWRDEEAKERRSIQEFRSDAEKFPSQREKYLRLALEWEDLILKDRAGLRQIALFSLAKERRQPTQTARMAHSMLAEIYADVLGDRQLLGEIRSGKLK